MTDQILLILEYWITLFKLSVIYILKCQRRSCYLVLINEDTFSFSFSFLKSYCWLKNMYIDTYRVGLGEVFIILKWLRDGQ